VLREYEQYPAVTVNWHFFGSSGHQKRPEGLVIENYLQCHDSLNRHVKSIINPRRAFLNVNSHYWIYRGWQQAVDENRQEVLGSFNQPPTGSRLRINHYYSKSAEDFLVKCNPDWWVDSIGNRLPTHVAERLDEAMSQHNEARDPSILRFVEATKAKMREFGANVST
jgi:hypothetical protein